MTAPLPLRFYNPVKELCAKVNLDYETVIGTGLSAKMREAFVCAEIKKPLEQIKSEDRKLIKHKKEFLDRKYGGTDEGTTGTGEVKDKGRERYDMGIVVEPVCPDDSKVDESETVLCKLEDGTIIKRAKGGNPRPVRWIPGKGVVG